MLPLMIAGAVGGGAFGIMQNQQRIKEAKDQKKFTDMKLESEKRQLGYTSEILTGNLSVAALSASASSKKAAVDAFQSESAREASVGASGLAGGSSFYNLDRQVVEDRNTLMSINSEISGQLASQELSGAARISGARDEIAMTTEQQRQMQERLGYLESPMAFMLSAASGAMSGAQMATDITSLGAKMTGNADFGQFDLGSLGSKSGFGGQPSLDATPAGAYGNDWSSYAPKFGGQPSLSATPAGAYGNDWNSYIPVAAALPDAPLKMSGADVYGGVDWGTKSYRTSDFMSGRIRSPSLKIGGTTMYSSNGDFSFINFNNHGKQNNPFLSN